MIRSTHRHPHRLPVGLSACAVLLATGLSAAPLAASVISPTGTHDSGLVTGCERDCTLRAAVMKANTTPGPDVILLAAGSYRLTVPGRGENAAAAGDLDVLDDLAILGAGADRTVVDAGGLDRAFELLGARLTLHGVTVRGGDAGNGRGGAVAADGTSSLYLVRSTVEDNRAGGHGGGVWAAGHLSVRDSAVVRNVTDGSGGGIAAGGAAEVIGSTFSANEAMHQRGGGIHVFASGSLDLRQSTLAHNLAMLTGGGVQVESGGAATIAGSILAENLTWAGGPDCAGPVVTGGHNLVSAAHFCGDLVDGVAGDQAGAIHGLLEPGIGPLAMNGGPTPSHAPLPGSPALDRGAPGPNGCAARDQRGEVRPASLEATSGAGRCDVGSVEASGRCVVGPDALCMAQGRFRVTASFTVDDDAPRAAEAVQLTGDTGYFWFFRRSNVEVVVKVLDACSAFDRFWVFASGMTNLPVTLRVDDLATGESRTYERAGGSAFTPEIDTEGFAGCSF